MGHEATKKDPGKVNVLVEIRQKTAGNAEQIAAKENPVLVKLE